MGELVYDPSLAERLEAISQLDASIAFDGCHKLYILDGADLALAAEYGYEAKDIFPASQIKDLWEKTCPLRLVHYLDLRDSPLDIPQGYTVDGWTEEES